MRCIALLALGVPLAIAAQTIGTGQFFQEGRSYLRDNYEPPLALAEQLAASAGFFALDLTPLNDATLYGTDSVVCEAAPPAYAYFSDYYDTANVQLTVIDLALLSHSPYVFLRDASGVRYVGGRPNGASDSGNDLIFQRYPDNAFALVLEDTITPGWTHTEQVHATWYDASGSDDHFVDGTVSMVADGHGSMVLPDGTFLPSTLRLRSVMDYVDSSGFFGAHTRSDTLYTWYAEDTDGPVMTMQRGPYILTSGYISPLPLTVYRHAGSSGVTERGASAGGLRVFPQPIDTRVTVQLPEGWIGADLEIHDAQGACVRHVRVTTARVEVDRGGLPAGAYTLHAARADGARISGRLVVQ